MMWINCIKKNEHLSSAPSTSSLENPTLHEEDKTQTVVKELQWLLSKIIKSLDDHGDLDTWVQFLRNVHAGSFPLDNISFQLFLDVVRWLNLGTKGQMRYSPDVKRFWATGYKLFRGKFLHFMGGCRCNGRESQIQSGIGESINFACPSDSVLRNIVRIDNEECQQPGILFSNIDTFCQSRKHKSYKLCLDGKKIMF